MKGSSEGATQVSFETSELGMIFFQGRRIFFVPQHEQGVQKIDVPSF
jgi:hypothetical protein